MTRTTRLLDTDTAAIISKQTHTITFYGRKKEKLYCEKFLLSLSNVISAQFSEYFNYKWSVHGKILSFYVSVNLFSRREWDKDEYVFLVYLYVMPDHLYRIKASAKDDRIYSSNPFMEMSSKIFLNPLPL